MPQLDIYTYFTQFQWLLAIFTLLFILINGKYITTFQSFFFSRNYLLNNLAASATKNESNFKGFDVKLKKENNKKTLVDTSGIQKWDQIYEKIRLSSTKKNRNKSNKKKSIKKSIVVTPTPQKKKGKKK